MQTHNTLSDASGYIWFNGEIVPYNKATMHVMNHGLHYGGAVFEGIKAYGGRSFRLSDHSKRLIQSGKMIGLEIPYSFKELDQAVIDLIAKTNIQTAYIRPIAWRSGGGLKIEGKECHVDVAIIIKESSSAVGKVNHLQGLRVNQAIYKRPSAEFAPVGSKASCLYTTATLCKRDAQSKGYDDALMLDYRENVCELTIANVFFIKNNTLHTPIADCCLAGITRQTVIDMAAEMDIEVIQRHIAPEELPEFESAFATGTALEIKMIDSIDLNSVKAQYKSSPIILDLIAMYHKLTGQ